jgi:hypothetical protein
VGAWGTRRWVDDEIHYWVWQSAQDHPRTVGEVAGIIVTSLVFPPGWARLGAMGVAPRGHTGPG